jgi:hypothetical protein
LPGEGQIRALVSWAGNPAVEAMMLELLAALVARASARLGSLLSTRPLGGERTALDPDVRVDVLMAAWMLAHPSSPVHCVE